MPPYLRKAQFWDTGSGASRGYGARFIPLELSSGRELAKKSPQNSSSSANLLFTVKKKKKEREKQKGRITKSYSQQLL